MDERTLSRTAADAPRAAEVLDILTAFAEEQTEYGDRWCPYGSLAALRSAVLRRNQKLEYMAFAGLRLAVALNDAHEGGAPGVLYQHVKGLQPDRLEAGFRHLNHDGARIEGKYLVLHGAAWLSEDSAPFRLSMRYLSACSLWLLFVSEALGFTRLTEAVDQARKDAAITGAAKALHRDLLDWLSERLSPEQAMRKAERVFAVLSARQDDPKPAHIDPGFVFDFWAGAAVDERAEGLGFRRFPNAARLLLAFQAAWEEAQLEEIARRTSPEFEGSDTGDKDDDDSPGGDPEGEESGKPKRSDVRRAEIGTWENPLPCLLEPPANRVKWLSGEEFGRLRRLLGSAGDAAGAAASIYSDGKPRKDHYRTLLRAIVFGAEQDRFSEHMRRRQNTPSALGNVTYESTQKDHARMSARLTEALAAAGRALYPENPKLAAFAEKTVKSTRAGLTAAEGAQAEVIEAFQAGIDAAGKLRGEIDAVTGWAGRLDLDTAYQNDQEAFVAVFRQLYPVASGDAAGDQAAP